MSVLGAAFILFVYYAFKDFRKGMAQKIITLLALADIGTAASLMPGILNLFVYEHYSSDISDDKESSACLIFYTICQIQAFILDRNFLSVAMYGLHYLPYTSF